MGSVGFIGESERQLRTSRCKKKHKLSGKVVECVALNYSSVPKKLRSGIKTRRRELSTQPIPILSGKRRVSDGVAETKDRGKKSKLNKREGRITEDEKEVAATLNALADMFPDVSKTNNEPSETKSSTIMEAGNSATAATDTRKLTKRKESKKISKVGAIEAALYSSNFLDSTSKSVKVATDKQSDTPVVQSDLRQKTTSLDVIPGGERAIAPLQVATPCVQYGKRNFHPKEDRSFASYQPPSLFPSRDLDSKTQGSCQRLPAWLENAMGTPKPQVTGSNINVDKNPHAAVEPKTSWKRCIAHVYISRLIQVLQMSSESEGLLEKSHRTTCSKADGGNNILFSNSIINSGVENEKNSSEIQNAILLHKRLVQEQQLPFNSSIGCSSTKQGSDYQLDDIAGINGASNNHDYVKRLHMSHRQYQNLYLQPRSSKSNFHGCTSATAAQQAQLPSFRFKSPESNVIEPFQQQYGSHHQKWPFQIHDRYNHGGVASAIPCLPAWQDGGRYSSLQLNHGQSLFPHMSSAPRPNYQPGTYPQHSTSPQLHNKWFYASPTNLQHMG